MRTKEIPLHFAKEPDFVIRQQLGLLLPTICLIVGTFVTLLLVSWTFPISEMPIIFSLLLFTVVAISISFTMVRLQRHRDLLLMSEFQNAMLASAARVQSRFCLIFKRDGALVYFDPGFQRLFPGAARQTISLEDMMDKDVFPRTMEEDLEKLLQAEKNGVLMMPLVTSEGAQKYVINVDLLPKPKGYFLMRGREFVEKRAAEDPAAAPTMPAPSQATALSPLQAWAHTTNVPFLVLDDNGIIIAASRPLLAKVQYDDVVGLPFTHIVYQINGAIIETYPTSDSQAPISLLLKSGALLPANMKFVKLDHGYVGFILFPPAA